MNMNILVLGGSYFLGRRFVEIASDEHTLTVFNRGNQPLHLAKISEIKGDRHDREALLDIPDGHYDAVVDFCAYSKGDIRLIFENLKAEFDRYVYISTCDVYRRGLGVMLDETAPLENRNFPGEAGTYISGKVELEKEIVECCSSKGTAYTSIRPAFIYGPYNYAPREGMYFRWIEKAGQILHPTDATGEFQMVYADDVVGAILSSVRNEKAINRAFNLAPLPAVNYDNFADILEKVSSVPFDKVPVTLEMITKRQIPLPFPLTAEESNLYDGRAVLQLIDEYTSLETGLKVTEEWYKNMQK